MLGHACGQNQPLDSQCVGLNAKSWEKCWYYQQKENTGTDGARDVNIQARFW